MLSKIRDIVNKYKLIFTTLMSIELGLSLYSIKNDLLKNNKKSMCQILNNCEVQKNTLLHIHKTWLYSLKEIIGDPSYIKYTIPMWKIIYQENISNLKYATNILYTDKAKLESAAKHPKTIEALIDIYSKDKNDTSSEIGGIITIDKDENGPYLGFYLVESELSPVIKEIKGYKGRYKDFIKRLKQAEENKKTGFKDKLNLLNKNEFFKNVMNIIERNRGKVKERELQRIMDIQIDILSTTGDYSYLLSRGALASFFWSNKLNGNLLAYFHTHEGGEVPSLEDFLASEGNRHIVVSFKNSGYTLYDLDHVENKSGYPYNFGDIIKNSRLTFNISNWQKLIRN